MKARFFVVIILLLVFGGLLYADLESEIYSRFKASLAPEDHSKVILRIQNRYVAVQCDTDDGQFNIGTSDDITLLYAFPSSPWSSHILVLVDGYQYTNDAATTTATIGLLPVADPFRIIPVSGDTSMIFGGWRIRGVDIKQTLMPVYLIYPTDTTGTVFIRYDIINNDTVPHSVGVMLEMDTMIGPNDAAPLATAFGYSAIERDFYAPDSMPPYWFAYEIGPEVPPDSQIVALGIINGFDAVPPDRFAVGRWYSFYNADWYYTVSPERYGDSAVLYWWNPITLAPGESRMVGTYYGLGRPMGRPGLNIGAPPMLQVRRCEYYPNPFDVTALVTNMGMLTLNNVRVVLRLGDGLAFPPGEDSVKSVTPPTLRAGESGTAGWHVLATGTHTGVANFEVCMRAAGGESLCAYGAIIIPEIGGRPTASLVYPLDGTRTTNPSQDIRISLRTFNGFSDASLVLNGREYLVSRDTSVLRYDGEFLTFTPSRNWSNNDTVRYAIVSAEDTVGCSLVSPVGAYFWVDLAPPVASNESPANGTILGTTELPPVSIRLVDPNSPVDTTSIRFTFNGVTYDISHPALSYDGVYLTFDPAVAGIVASDGDTFYASLDAAADIRPDYGSANNLTAPYSWWFTVNILDLALVDTSAFPAETLLIPVRCEDLSPFGIRNFDIRIRYNESVLQPIGIVTTGTATSSGWRIELTSSGGIMRIVGSGSGVSSERVLFYVRVIVRTDAPQGAFSRIEFETMSFNDGRLAARGVDGIIVTLWTYPEWIMELILEDEIVPDSRTRLTFGVASSGTDYFDSGLDIIALPPTPGKPAYYFEIADPYHPYITGLSRDIRNNEILPITWRVRTTSSTHGILRWNPTLLPEGSFILNGYIDMHRDSIYYFGLDEVLTIEYSRPELMVVSAVLKRGWNLVSLPVYTTTRFNLADIYPTSVGPVYWFDPTTRSYTSTTVPEPGRGYWLLVYADDTVRYAGSLVSSVVIPVKRGWNLIGGPYSPTPIPLSSVRTEPEGILMPGSFYKYNPYREMYEMSESFETGVGYWILAMRDGFMYISRGSRKQSSSTLLEPSFVYSLACGDKVYELGFDSRSKAGMDEFDIFIPPQAPCDAGTYGFDIEGFSASRDIKPFGENVWVLRLANLDEISWDSSLIPDEYEFVIVDGEDRVNMREESRYVPRSGAIKIIARPLVPKTLGINAYPSPFNTNLNIEVDIPVQSNIKLDIWDILGKKVISLAGGRFDAGRLRFVWDGKDERMRDVSSGIYFVSVEQGSNKVVKKVILLK